MKLELLQRTDLAVRALRLLGHGERRTSDEIAEALGSTPRFIPHVMGPLVSAGFVESARGPSGGYTLTPTGARASMLAVIESIEGPTDTGKCVLRGGPCPGEELCSLHDAWTTARTALTKQLDDIPALSQYAVLEGGNA